MRYHKISFFFSLELRGTSPSALLWKKFMRITILRSGQDIMEL